MQYRLSIIGNPYFTYIISFLIVIFFYSLGWSDLFPLLTYQLILFFLSTFFITIIFAFIFNISINAEHKIYPNNQNSVNQNICIVIHVAYIIEFIYNKGIPLLLIINGQEYDYSLFGIPTFHVVLVTFSSFFTIYLFNIYIDTNTKVNFFLYFSLLLEPILIFNRGLLLYILFSTFLVVIIKSRNKIKVILKLLIVFIGLMYLFGIAGDIRSDKIKDEDNLYSLMEQLAQPSDNFKSLGISPTFLWSYIYLVSPLGNLQHNIIVNNDIKFNINNTPQFLLEEIIPDAFSKKMLNNKTQPSLIIDNFNVSTIFANSYVLLGWLGMYMIFFFSLLFSFIYYKLLNPHGPFYLTGIVLINTLIFFNLFSNMFSFSGMSLQLIFPLLAQTISRIRIIL